MSELLNKLGWYLPIPLYALIWVLLAPFRVAILLMLPPKVSRTVHHPLSKIHDFLSFE